jgi:hypothetical protein
METRFMELANTELTDKEFFEDVFSNYINYLYSKNSCVEELALIRLRFNQNDPHIKYHLRDQIESVLYRYNKMEYDFVVAEKMEMKKKIEQMEEKIETILKRIEFFLMK